MRTTRFSVPDIHCDHCKTSIEGAVAPADGVQRVEVDIPGRFVTVDHDVDAADRAHLTSLIEDQGYVVERFEEVEEA